MMFDPNQFKRVIAYYRDCLDNDAERSVVFRQGDEGQKYIPLKLEMEWTLSGKGELRADLVRDKSRFASELRQRRSSAEIMYGYPFLIKRSDNRGISLIPVFLLPVDYDLNGDELSVRLVHDWPIVNEEFCRSIGVSMREEKAQLYEQLGLTADKDLPSEGLGYFVRRLKDLQQLPEGELLDPSCIPKGSISQAAKFAGMLNRHALVLTDRPPFTRGLDAELSMLTQSSRLKRADATATGFFFGVSSRNRERDGDRDQSHSNITEVVPLNEEQRRAVRSAFHDDLTVVTGPPGTGKSQVVTTVIANAWFRGQSVLFASYNHKAVDVVEDRVNGLTSKPLMIRTGRRSGDRELRNEIIKFLSNVLASDVSDQERDELTESRRIVERLEQSRTVIWKDLENVRELRNRVDQIDKGITRIKPKLEQKKRECEATRRDRDDRSHTIDTEIQQLSSAIEILRSHGDRVDVNHPHIDNEFATNIGHLYDDLDSLRDQIELATRIRDAETDFFRRKLARLRSEFDPNLLNRRNSQELNAIRSLMLNAQATLVSQTGDNTTIWGNLWKRLRRRTDFKRVKALTESWMDDYDILGKPPSGPIATERLAMWSSYVTDAIARLGNWKNEFERNQQTVVKIDECGTEIRRVEADFESNRFEIREATIERNISALVEREVQSLRSQVDEQKTRLGEVKDEFDSADQRRADVEKTFNERSRDFDDGVAKLRELPKVSDLANQLADVEKQIWDAGARLVDAAIRIVPDRFDDDDRNAIGDFRALFERLRDDRLGGPAYRRLMREMEMLFPKVMSALPAWCVTNLSARGHIPLHAGMFDLVVIDEASQCSVPSALPLLYRAKRAMVIGDPNQLRHITKIGLRKDQELQVRYGMESASDAIFSFSQQSLFDVAARNANPIALREHFRSHADIIGFSNQHWYDGTLVVCSDYGELRVPTDQTAGISWHQTNGQVERSSRFNGNVNEMEAKELANLVVELIADRGFRGSVGIVTPFRAQANLIRSILNENLETNAMRRCDLITDTSHAFQGDERDVVFFSPCVDFEMPEGAEWFIRETGNLFNVAITRARAMLVVVGNREACLASKTDHVKGFAQFCETIIDGENRHEHPSGFRPGPDVGQWEEPFYQAMLEAGLKPMHQYVDGQNRLDFALVTENVKLNVEVDGELYHREWDGRRSRADLARDRRLIGQGWKVKRFWIYELRDDMERCVDEVKALVA